ncbi:hypothetical protein G6F56_001984 [Rhizopus delemar]|nr:hypothetical protein G6F56_001984 [Rhizopus delemar]
MSEDHNDINSLFAFDKIDHCLLQTKFKLPIKDTTPQIGSGLWRAHPSLASDESFCAMLKSNIESLFANFTSELTPQRKWEYVKELTKDTAVRYFRHKAFNLQQGEKILQKKRSGFKTQLLSAHFSPSDTLPQLRVIEHQLSSLQQYRANTLALRASFLWREKGENSAGYLKRTIQQKARLKNISCLRHPVTTVMCHSKDCMLQAASSFYTSLYTPDPIEPEAVDQLFSSLSSEFCISTVSKPNLVLPFTLTDIDEAVRRCPQQSSPRSDGLSYTILSVLLDIPACQSVFLQVLNGALTDGIFPPFWSDTRVSLLPKKGEIGVPFLSDLITPFQTGFMRGRFIADNDLLMKLIMDHCSRIDSSAVGILLDQEKAYDRIHPEYVRQVLVLIEIPPAFVNSISNLFFGTYLQINDNKFFSPPILQQRGLRQGDPLSPVLFNLDFEPFLRSILQDQLFKGISLPFASSVPPLLSTNASPVKLMAYADDVICLLQNPEDLNRLLSRFQTYSRASNSLLNCSKTQVISLSGPSLIYTDIWRSTLQSQDIRTLHDHTSPNALVTDACNIHSQRLLSVRGRATFVNTLILSTLWYVLQVTSVPFSFLDQVRSCVSKFVTSGIFPRLSFDTMCLPRTFGGLGVLDPSVQQRTLQIRWLIPLLRPTHSPSSPLRVLRSSIMLPHLAHFVLTHSCPPSVNTLSWYYRLPFLFPELRGSLLSHLIYLCHSYFQLYISSLKIDDDATLRARLRSEMVCFPNLSKKFLTLVSGSHLSLAPFFLRTFLTASSASMTIPTFVPASHSSVDVTPFVDALFGLPPSGI